jgi:rubredoxin
LFSYNGLFVKWIWEKNERARQGEVLMATTKNISRMPGSTTKKPVLVKAKPASKAKVTTSSAKKPVPAAKKKPVAIKPKTVASKKSPVASSSKKPGKPTKKSVKPKKVPARKMQRYRCRICGYIYSPLRGEPHNGIPEGTVFEDLPGDYLCPVCGFQGKGRIGKWGFEEWRPTKYVCSICGYIYDEARGEPHRGIKPGTKLDDLPDDYVCPVCALDPKISVQFGKVFKQGFEPLDL